MLVWPIRVNNLLEIIIRQLIPILKLSVVLVFLLNSIVCEVNKLVIHISQGEIFDAGSKVSIFKEIAFHAPRN